MDVQNKVLFFALVTTLLLTGLPSYSQTPPNRGFQTPGSTFNTNPFNKPTSAIAPSDDEEDIDDTDLDEISEEILRQRLEQRLRDQSESNVGKPDKQPSNSNKKTQGQSVDFTSTANAVGAQGLAGGANTKITQSPDTSGCLKLDPYTGYGPDIITNFDFPNAEIVEIAKTLGRLTCQNFLFDKDVRGTISVISNAPITVGDAWKAFLTALDVNGFTIIPSGKYLRISRQRDAKDKQIKTYTGDFTPDNDLYVTRVLALKYISAEEVARVFRNFMPPNTRIVSYDQTNTLIVTDTGSNINKIIEMVQLLDIEGYDESLEVIRIKNASAQEIAKLIDQLLPGSAGAGAAGGQPGGVPRFRGFSARKTKEGGVISHIIPDDRTNSVIVSANARGLEQVKELIKKLDDKVSASLGSNRIHVVYLQFADAEQISTTLGNLTSGSGAPKVAPGLNSPGGASPTQLFEGAIKISADKATNSLVITASPNDYTTMTRVIQKLDVPRDQVYVEAVIMEVTLQKTFELGSSLVVPNAGVGFMPDNNFTTFLSNPLALNGLVMGFKSGQGKTFSIPGSDKGITISSIQGLVKALQINTNANVLSTPQILTLDNQQATIEVSENIPILSTTAVAGSAPSQSVSREKIALSLTIKPQINKISNFVKLDIKQKIEDISNRTPPKGVADFAFATLSRSSETTVVVQDGDTVALGGLVRDKVEEKSTKIPLLGDIPLLGWLFRKKETESVKQNLIALITPKIIKQYQHVRKILDKKIRERDEFIEKNAGADDPHQDYKMKVIRELPPVSELRSGDRIESSDVESGDSPDRDEQTKPENSTSLKSSAIDKTTSKLDAPKPAIDKTVKNGVEVKPSGVEAKK